MATKYKVTTLELSRRGGDPAGRFSFPEGSEVTHKQLEALGVNIAFLLAADCIAPVSAKRAAPKPPKVDADG